MLLSLALSFLFIPVNQHQYRNIYFLSLYFLHFAPLLVPLSSVFQKSKTKKQTRQNRGSNTSGDETSVM